MSNMTFSNWQSLSESEQKEKCQYLDPYEDEEIFRGVENAFRKEYGQLPGVAQVHCGLGPFIGPYNSIFVEITEEKTETRLPRFFFGFPVISDQKHL